MLADSQGRGLIIWPIAIKLFQSVMLQQRPRWTGGLRIGVGSQRHAGIAPSLPWINSNNRPPVINYGRYNAPPIAMDTLKPTAKPAAKPAVVHALKVMPTEVFEIIGVSRNNLGVALENCTMSLFRVDRDGGNNIVYTHLGNTKSDASGNYMFVVRKGAQYFVKAINDGGTVFGVSNENLTGTLM